MTLEEEFSLLLDCGVTLEEDFALLLDFAELLDRSSTGVEDDERTELLDFAELLDTLVSLLLDFGVTLEDDDCAELLDRFSPPSAELRAGSAEDDERTELLDFALDEEFDFTELLLASSQSSQTLDDGSSSRGAKLLSSSPQPARKNAKASAKMQIKEKRFIIPQIVCQKYRKA